MLYNLLYLPINSLGYPRKKKLQRDNLWHAYNEPINFYSVNLKMLLLIRTYSSQRSGLLMPKFMYIYIGIWWGWRNHKAELAIVQQPLSTKYDMEWNLLLFTTRLLACSVSTKGWRFMKKGLIFLMFLFLRYRSL